MYLDNNLGFDWHGQLVRRYPYYIHLNDEPKLENDYGMEGLFVRLSRVVEASIFEDLVEKCTKLFQSNLAALGCTEEAELLLYLASNVGLPPNFTIDGNYYRVVAAAQDLKNWRGSSEGYRKVFSIMDITVDDLIEHPIVTSVYDSGTTNYDDGISKYDNSETNTTCSDFTLYLVGDVVMDYYLLGKLRTAIEYNRPINAKLRAAYYNGNLISNLIFYIYIDANGDLVFDNYLNLPITLTLDDQGDLYIESSDPAYPSTAFSISSEGYLLLNL
jgi:hypothetical protein